MLYGNTIHLSLRVRVDLGVIAMKWYSKFLKTPVLDKNIPFKLRKQIINIK